jgi:hypothetical protein|nr:MAG TPA: hypothetical protein [Caudoviricetes sp.]
MNTRIIKSQDATTGYAIVIEDGNGDLKTINLDKMDKSYPNLIVLPTNPANRKWISKDKLDAIKNFPDDGLKLEYKESRKLGSHTHETKPLEDYLEEDDRKTYRALIEKAKANKEAAIAAAKAAANDPVKKLEAQIEKMQAQLKALKEAK